MKELPKTLQRSSISNLCPLLVLLFIIAPAHCISLNINSCGSFLSADQTFDQSTRSITQSVISGNTIASSGYISGQGDNTQTITSGNSQQTALGSISSSGLIESAAAAKTSDNSVALAQSTNALGLSEMATSGLNSDDSAIQKAGVLSGDLSSSQSIFLGKSSITSSQGVSAEGALAYIDSSVGDTKATGGLNGVGKLTGHLSSQDDAIQGAIQGESNAYSALKTPHEYSYTSGDQLSASLGQTLQSTNEVQTFASTSSESALIPVPGSWVWNGYGGYLTSNPSIAKNDQGDTFCYVRGGDNALYVLAGKDWYGLGGVITSDPYAVKDYQGIIHVFARGADGSLWDDRTNTASKTHSWLGLGGYITSDPSAVVTIAGMMDIVARGGDGGLWINTLNPYDNTNAWYGLGGQIASNPQIIQDSQNNLNIFTRGGAGDLWVMRGILGSDNIYHGSWYSLGGQIRSDPKPMIDPNYPYIINVVAVGADGDLWGNVLNTNDMGNTWHDLNAPVSPASSVYQGNVEPLADASGNIHIFYRGTGGDLKDMMGTYYPQQKGYGFSDYSLGGYITSDPDAVLVGSMIKVAARGGDGSLWINEVKG